MAGSILPHLVVITNPSKGVKPIEVSRGFPFLTAVIELPPPKWQVINLFIFLPRIFSARSATYWWEIP